MRQGMTPIGPCPLCQGGRVSTWMHASDRFHARRELYHLAKCADCSLVWQTCPPAATDMAQHYGADYHRAITHAAETSGYRWTHFRDAILAYKQAGDLLDIGCSSGSFLAAFAGRPWKLHGIEISADVASRARAKTGAEIFVGDINDAPFAPASFDVITSFDVLEHLSTPVETIARISRWLKPGGILYVFIPNVDSWESRVFRSYWFGLELPRHLFHFSPRSLRTLMGLAGLRQLSLRTPTDNYVEHSVKYLVDDLARRIGVARPPLSAAAAPSLPFRVLRKAARVSAFAAWGKLASLACAGPAIEAVFRKE